jgi:hypothetical protein
MNAITATADKAGRARLRLLACFLPVTAVLYIGAEALNPKGTDEVVTSAAVALRLLPIAAAHSSQLYLSGSLSVLALGGLAVSYAAIATLITGRGVGAFAGAMLNVLGGITLAVAASAHTTHLAAAQFLVTSFASGPAEAAEYVYVGSEYLAPVVMGFALWRSRRVPRWLAVLFTVALEVAEQQAAVGPVVVLLMLPFAVAMILLAVKIWRAAARPAPMTNPAPADHAGQLADSNQGI